MKKILVFLMGLVTSLSLSSCIATVYAQDDTYFDGEVDATVVISYGTPYIVNDLIEYYFYRGWYYYPHWVGDTYFFRRYRRPLLASEFRNWYRPIQRHHVYHKPPRNHMYDSRHRPHNPIPDRKSAQPYQRRHNTPIMNNRGTRLQGEIHKTQQGVRPRGNMSRGSQGIRSRGNISGSHRSSTRIGGRR